MQQHDKTRLRISGKPANWLHTPPPHPAHLAHLTPEVRPYPVAPPEPVILFMEDGKGSGVPVLGRRVPLAAAAAYGMLEAPEALFNEQPAVVGRRSHRLYHNNNNAHQHQQQQQQHRLMIKSHQLHHKSGAMIMSDARGQQYQQAAQQAVLSGLQIGRSHHQPRKANQQQRLHQSRSSANLAAAAEEAYLDAAQQLNCWPAAAGQHASGRRHGQLVGPATGGGRVAPRRKQDLISASSCSSLCSAGDECRGAGCCSPQQQVQATCLEPCCAPSYAANQCRRACCRPPTANKSILAANKPSRQVAPESPTGDHYLYLPQQQQHQHQRQGRTRLAHGGGAAQRASSSHELGRRRRLEAAAAEEQPMRISGRNLLPVKRRVQVHQQPQQHSAGAPTGADQAVSQIYESLAAELKAKLGDPRLAPILLPPKDYDTLSRRQGRLSDIELRRSTNPKLVGATQRLQASESRPLVETGGAPAKSRHQLLLMESRECDSARSSGRQSHLEEGSLVSRSRSNSSSGLGSISMGAGSPHSTSTSKSASSEDMCPSTSAGKSPTDGGRFSDSGHSESGGGGAAAKSRANSDYQRHQLVGGSPAAPATGAKSAATQHLESAAKPSLETLKSRLTGKGPDGTLRWKGRVEIPLKVNSDKNGNTYLATKQIIY